MAWRTWLLCFLMAGMPVVAVGQEHQGRYAPIPFQGDPAALLRQRLLQVQRLDELLRRYDKLSEKLKQSHIELPPLSKLDESTINPEKLKAFSEAVKKLEAMAPEERKEINKLVEDVKQKQTEIAPAMPQQGAPLPEKMNVPAGGPKPAEVGEGDLQDRLGRWTLDLLEKAEDTKFGEMMQHSPAWQRAISDLKEVITNPHSHSGSWKLGLGKLSLPAGLKASLRKTWERMSQLEMPELPHVELTAPALGITKPLSRLPVPRRWPASESLWWLGVIAVAALIGWQFWKRSEAKRKAVTTRRLGPWPVPPDQVSTSADLIAAFEYLAALRVGMQVRTWNHRAVADALGGNGFEPHRAAEELAALYAEARYSPEPPTLSPATVALARRDLCLLAGVGSS